MNIATSIEQSKKLLSLGIKPETADMSYLFDKEDKIYNYCPIVGKLFNDNDIPSWSLSALFELLGKLTGLFKLEHTEIGSYIALPNYKHITETYNSPIDAAVEMIEWLATNKYLNI